MLTQSQITRIVNLIIGSEFYDFDGNGTDIDELGCTREEWELICMAGRKKAESLLRGVPAFGSSRDVIAYVRKQKK